MIGPVFLAVGTFGLVAIGVGLILSAIVLAVRDREWALALLLVVICALGAVGVLGALLVGTVAA